MKNFIFNNKKYEYFDHPSNQTAINERRIELPLAFEFMEQQKGKSILEVGNVVSHYKNEYRTTHDVVDLNEFVPWRPIINEDILTFQPAKQYKAALSISTLEHVENQEEAIKKVLSLAPNILITVPMGYHKISGFIHKYTSFYMIRLLDTNLWRQATYDEVKIILFGPFGNAIAIIKR